MPSTIQFHRNLDGAPVALPATGAEAEPFYANGGFTWAGAGAPVAGTDELVIWNGTAMVPMISRVRQVETVGAQFISGAKTFVDPILLATTSGIAAAGPITVTTPSLINLQGDLGVEVAGRFTVRPSSTGSEARLDLQPSAGGIGVIHGYKGALERWRMLLGGGDPESTADAGSYFLLEACDDAGVVKGASMRQWRSAGFRTEIFSMDFRVGQEFPVANNVFQFRAGATGTDESIITTLGAAGITLEKLLTLFADPTLPMHAATKQYVDANAGIAEPVGAGTWSRLEAGTWERGVAVAGDTMTGFLTLNADPTAPLHAATMQYVDAAALAEPVGAGTWARTAAGAWERSIAIAGDAMVGDLTLGANLLFPGAPIAAPATADTVWSSGGVLIKTLAPPAAAGANINIVAQDSAATANNGGSIFITTGTAAAAAGYGGTLTLRSGDGGTEAGSINLYGGDGTAAGSNGGQVRLAAGDGLQEGGPVSLLAGDGDVEGGSVIITAGDGATLGGAIEFRAGGPNGEIRIYNQAIVQLGVPLTLGQDPALAMHAVTKQYVDGLISNPLIFAGTYDAATDAVDPTGAGTPGPLPVADATNNGRFVIVSVAGTGIGNAAPLGALGVEDWIICGEVAATAGTYAWHVLSVASSAVAAINVGVTAIPGMTATNVQAALEELETTKLETITVLASLVGNGTPGSPLDVAIVDGGVF